MFETFDKVEIIRSIEDNLQRIGFNQSDGKSGQTLGSVGSYRWDGNSFPSPEISLTDVSRIDVLCDCKHYYILNNPVVNRPRVARAVLQTPLPFINKLTD